MAIFRDGRFYGRTDGRFEIYDAARDIFADPSNDQIPEMGTARMIHEESLTLTLYAIRNLCEIYSDECTAGRISGGL